jgi:hypothetical protein
MHSGCNTLRMTNSGVAINTHTLRGGPITLAHLGGIIKASRVKLANDTKAHGMT